VSAPNRPTEGIAKPLTDTRSGAVRVAGRLDVLARYRDHVVDELRREGAAVFDAEDCVHDAMLAVARRDWDRRADVLLLRAARAQLLRGRRSRDGGHEVALCAVNNRGGPTSCVEEVVMHRQELAAAFDAITLLPPRERQAFVLHLGGLTVMQTARSLGVSFKTIEGTFTRARARLQRLLAMADSPSMTSSWWAAQAPRNAVRCSGPAT